MMKLALLVLAATVADPLAPLHVRGRVAGYFVASSATPDRQALGGFGLTDNLPRPIERSVAATGKVTLTVLPSETVAFDGKYEGFRVILSNETESAVWFDASDSRLNVVREALDSSGRWKPVEYLPSSWCGNSYHRLALPARHYWSFAAPVFHGAIRTKMRFVLRDKHHVVHSNEFESTVDALQFEQDEPILLIQAPS